MNKKFKIVLIFIAGMFTYFVLDLFVISKEINTDYVIVENGDTYKDVYNKLNFKYNLVDKIYFKLNPLANKLQKGKYILKSKLSKYELINSLDKPYFEEITLTIPEGFTQKQIFERIESLGLANEEEMLNALNSIDFPYYHLKDNFDGYLYPETYIFSKNDKAIDVARTILNEFLKHFPEKDYVDKKLFYENLKLASIVEFETDNFEDKQKVAGVFKHRLRINMLLQSDATLKYELNRMAYKKELMTSNSLYNSYKHKGLPPTPICNPSKETIFETLKAVESEYLYFFMENGNTYYSKTHEEHLAKRRAIK